MECSPNIVLFELLNKNQFISFNAGIKNEKQSMFDNRGKFRNWF